MKGGIRRYINYIFFFGNGLLSLNSICRKNKLKPATHLVILYADRDEFDRQRNRKPPIDADTPGDFLAGRGDVALQHCSCDKIAQPD